MAVRVAGKNANRTEVHGYAADRGGERLGGDTGEDQTARQIGGGKDSGDADMPGSALCSLDVLFVGGRHLAHVPGGVRCSVFGDVKAGRAQTIQHRCSE